jgi:hypothetical protein
MRLFLLLFVANLGCSGGSSPTGSGGSGAGGSGGDAGSTCAVGGDLANLVAPAGEGFGEAVVVAAGSEAAVTVTRWQQSRDVTVELQRINVGGAVLGSPIPLHTYHVCCGQLAIGDFYGGVSMTTDGSRYLLCWGEAYQIGCATVPVGGGNASFSALLPTAPNVFITSPHVALGPSGWYVFYLDGSTALAQLLGDDAKPMGAPVAVPEGLVTGTTSGFAVVSRMGAGVSRLGPDLKTTAGPIPFAPTPSAIVALGDALSIVGEGSETRIDASNQSTQTVLADSTAPYAMAVAPRQGAVGVVWRSGNDALRFRAVDAASHAGPVEDVGCVGYGIAPSISAVSDGFLVATPDPAGTFQIFYAPLSPTIRVAHVPQP